VGWAKLGHAGHEAFLSRVATDGLARDLNRSTGEVGPKTVGPGLQNK
jgi:hypothetical protein